MNIQKINGNYVADQDRILMRISTSNHEELRLWLTRRSCMDFLAKTEDLAVKSIEKADKKALKTAKIIDEFNQNVLAEKLDYQIPFEPQNKLPLGHEPILVKEIQLLNLAEEAGGEIQMSLFLINGKTLSSPLTLAQLNTIRLLMTELVAKAHWDDLPKNPAFVPTPPKNVLH